MIENIDYLIAEGFNRNELNHVFGVRLVNDTVGLCSDVGSGFGRTETVGNVCIVSIGCTDEYTPIQIVSLLVHEAVHVWQHWCDYIGETNPGYEHEAYSIESISLKLMEEFSRKTGKKIALKQCRRK